MGLVMDVQRFSLHDGPGHPDNCLSDGLQPALPVVS